MCTTCTVYMSGLNMMASVLNNEQYTMVGAKTKKTRLAQLEPPIKLANCRDSWLVNEDTSCKYNGIIYYQNWRVSMFVMVAWNWTGPLACLNHEHA